MEDLQTYLKLPDTQQLYTAGMELFKKYGINSHGHHLSTLTVGPFGNNRQLLLSSLLQISKLPAYQAPKATIVKVDQSPIAAKAPSTEREIELAIALRKLRHKRAQASQQFHACADGNEGDPERALICDRIDQINSLIKKTAGKLTYLQQFGHLPAEEEKQVWGPMPETIEGCTEERQKLSSHILKVEKRIVYLLDLRETDSKRIKQLPKNQEKLQGLVARRSAIRIKLKQLENASST